MYTKFGFRVVGRRPHYYADNNEAAILMTLNELGPRYIKRLDNLIHEDNSQRDE
jgi:hypothetical protein